MKLRKGQMLVEVLLALTITGLSLIALTRLSTRSISNTIVASDSNDAKLYANEGMEWIRQQRLYDTTYSVWSTFKALTGSPIGGPASTRYYCQTTLTSAVWSSSSATPCMVCADVSPGFRREVRVSDGTSNSVNVAVNVYKSGTCTSHIDLNTVFTNYQ